MEGMRTTIAFLLPCLFAGPILARESEPGPPLREIELLAETLAAERRVLTLLDQLLGPFKGRGPATKEWAFKIETELKTEMDATRKRIDSVRERMRAAARVFLSDDVYEKHMKLLSGRNGDTGAALDAIADLLATTDDPAMAKRALAAVRRIAEKPADGLAPHFRALPRHKGAWDLLHAEAPELYAGLSSVWWKANRPKTTNSCTGSTPRRPWAAAEARISARLPREPTT